MELEQIPYIIIYLFPFLPLQFSRSRRGETNKLFQYSVSPPFELFFLGVCYHFIWIEKKKCHEVFVYLSGRTKIKGTEENKSFSPLLWRKMAKKEEMMEISTWFFLPNIFTHRKGTSFLFLLPCSHPYLPYAGFLLICLDCQQICGDNITSYGGGLVNAVSALYNIFALQACILGDWWMLWVLCTIFLHSRLVYHSYFGRWWWCCQAAVSEYGCGGNCSFLAGMLVWFAV